MSEVSVNAKAEIAERCASSWSALNSEQECGDALARLRVHLASLAFCGTHSTQTICALLPRLSRNCMAQKFS